MTDLPRVERDEAVDSRPMTAMSATVPAAGTRTAGPGLAPATARQRATRPAATPAARTARRARLTVKRVDPWSVLKFGFVFSVAMLVVWTVAIAALYSVLHSMGVFDHLNKVLSDFTTKNGVTQYQVSASTSQVAGWAAVVGAVNAILFTALLTLGAFIYNLCSSLSGGIEVTLTERD